MARISKTNRFNEELYNRVRKISTMTRIPFSRLLDEGLEYLAVKYLGVPKDNIPMPKPLKISDDTSDDLISISKMASLIGVDVTSVRYWIRHGKIKVYRKSDGTKALNFVSKQEVLNFNAKRLEE